MSLGPATGPVGAAEIVGYLLDDRIGLAPAGAFTPLEVGASGLRHPVGALAGTAQGE